MQPSMVNVHSMYKEKYIVATLPCTLHRQDFPSFRKNLRLLQIYQNTHDTTRIQTTGNVLVSTLLTYVSVLVALHVDLLGCMFDVQAIR